MSKKSSQLVSLAGLAALAAGFAATAIKAKQACFIICNPRLS